MSHLILICTLFVVSATRVAEGLQQGEAAGLWRPLADFTECEGLPAGQVVCADECKTVLLCMGGSLPPTVLDECGGALVCSAEERKCTNGTSACSRADTNITCNGVGMFPDPYDCTVYHICSGADTNSTREECDSGWAYDSVTATCSKTPTDSVCTDLPITCNSRGESGVFPGNPNIYYICVPDADEELIPSMYRCEHGGTYDPDAFSCIDPATASPSPTAFPPSQAPTPPSGATPPSSGPTSPSSETPTATPPSTGELCSTPLEIVPDPASCYSYYQCSAMYVWAFVECNTGYYFNREQLRCMYGNCPYR